MQLRNIVKKAIYATMTVSLLTVGASVVYAETEYVNPLNVLNNRGFSTHFMTGNTKKDMESLKNMGANVIRDEEGWSTIEHRKGVYSFDGFNTTYLYNAKKAGIDVILCLDYWNNLYVDGAIDTDSEREGFANYCKAVARKYPFVNKFEIYNEPNLCFDWNWHENPTDYVKLLKTASDALKSVNPEATIVGGSFSDYLGIESYYSKFYAMEDVYSSADAISIHPYWYYIGTPQSVYESRLRFHNEYLSSIGGFKDLYITELGFPTVSNGSGNGYSDTPARTEEQQAADLIKSYTLGDYYNVSKFLTYDFKDDGTDPNNNEHNFGVIKNDGTEKKSYTAIKEMNSRISGAPYMGTLVKKTDGATASEEIHIYNVDGNPVALAWYNKDSDKNAKKTYEFDNDVDVYDIYGNKKMSGKYISLTSEPVYIYGLSETTMYQAVQQRTQKYISLAVMAAEKLTGNNAQSVKKELDNIASTLKINIADSEDSEDSLTIFNQIMNLGNDIIANHKDGTITVDEKNMGTLLDYMSNAAENILKIYETSQLDSENYERKADDMISICSKNILKSDSDVAKAILKRAKKYNENALKLSNQSGIKMGCGMVEANDILASRLVEWANNIVPDMEGENDNNITVDYKFDDEGYLTITGKVDKGCIAVSLYVLKPSANGVVSPQGIDCVEQVLCNKDNTFKKRYKTCGERGIYTIAVSSKENLTPRKIQAVFCTENDILGLVQKLKQASSAEETVQILTTENDILCGFSSVFAEAISCDVTNAQLGESIYRRRSAMDTNSETEFKSFIDEIVSICALNNADASDMGKMIEKYASLIGFNELNAYKTYMSATESLKTIICEKLSSMSFDNTEEWCDTFSSNVVLSAIEYSNPENMYDIIKTNNDKLNISFEEYNMLSNENKYRAMKDFCELNIYFGRKYSSYDEARKGFDDAVAMYRNQLKNVDLKRLEAGRPYSDETYTFKLAGKTDKTFVMLDKDDSGDMFVITKEGYGKKSACGSDNTRYSTITEDGVEKINYDDSNQMLHWLTNDFLTNGYEYNGVLYKLPDEIINNLRIKDWQFEPVKLGTGQTMPQGEMTAKVSLLSLSEYQKYKDIIGYDDEMDSIVDESTGWGGWHTRTLATGSYLDTRIYISRNSPEWGYGGAAAFAIRPCFYLNKEFVLNTKLDVDSMGGMVKKYIRESYSREVLAAGAVGYSEEELDKIYDVSEISVLDFEFRNDENKKIETLSSEENVKGVYTFENNVDYSVYATLIIASYDKNSGKFLGISVSDNPARIPAGASTEIETPILNIGENVDNVKIKSYVWNETSSMKPYIQYCEIQ